MANNDIERDAVVKVSIEVVDPVTGETLKETTAISAGSFKTLTYDDLGDIDAYRRKFDGFEKETLRTVARAQKQIADGYSQSGEKKRK